MSTTTRQHDLNHFIKEKSCKNQVVYYKLRQNYLIDNLSEEAHGVSALQIQFIDITERSDVKEDFQHLYKGMALIVSVLSQARFSSLSNISFFSNSKEILQLERYCVHSSHVPSYSLYAQGGLLSQPINGKSAFTFVYSIDEEQLKLLCDTSDISAQIVDEKDDSVVQLKLTNLKGFNTIAQYFYNLMVDENAYPNAERELTSIYSKIAEEREKERDKEKEKKAEKARREREEQARREQEERDRQRREREELKREKEEEWKNASLLEKASIFKKNHGCIFYILAALIIYLILLLSTKLN